MLKEVCALPSFPANQAPGNNGVWHHWLGMTVAANAGCGHAAAQRGVEKMEAETVEDA